MFHEMLKEKAAGAQDTIEDTAGQAAGQAADFAADVTGAEEYAESDQAAELRSEMQDAQEQGGLMGAASAFDTAARAGFDYVLDNPEASVQDSTRGAIETVTGVESEDQGEAAADLGEDVNEAYTDAKEGTPLDNPVTDAVESVGEVFVADPAKAGLTAATGIDMDTGSTEGNIGAVDAFDVGVTVGTAGVGKAGLSAARGAAKSDEAAGLVGRLLGRGGDEAGEGGARVMTDGGEDVFNPRNLPVLADEAAQGTDEGADAASSFADDAMQGGILGGLGRTGAGLADRAGGLVDEIAGRVSRVTDDAAAGADDAASAADDAAAGADDSAGLVDDALSGSDEAAQGADEAADEGAGALRRMLGTTSGKVAAGTAGALAGGALLESLGTFDRLEVTDPATGESYALTREKQYQPTQQRDGGILWEVRTGTAEGGYTNRQGYTVMVGASGRNVYILDENGNRTRAQVPVETFQEAVQRANGNSQGGAA
jgi:hypothetical protein